MHLPVHLPVPLFWATSTLGPWLILLSLLSSCQKPGSLDVSGHDVDGGGDLMSPVTGGVLATLDRSGEGYPPSEPSIAINPLDPDHLVAGAITDKVYVSRDGGNSWTLERLESSFGVFGDPCVIADGEGAFYYLHLADPSGQRWKSQDILDRIVIQRSDDGGTTWSDGGFMGHRPPKHQDKEWAAIDPLTGYLYATWTEFDKYGSEDPEHRSRILFSRSTDRGETWSDARVISEREGDCVDDDETPEGAVPAVGPKGEIYVSWSHAGKIYFDCSLDRGQTWESEDRIIADQPGGWSFDIPGLSRANGMPITGCDLSDGPNRGTLYVNWCDQRHGEDNTDVFLARSKDGGLTWSEPIRVNDDDSEHHQFFTWMDVDPCTGFLYFVFYDRRIGEGIETQVVLAYSEDGGDTIHNIRISETSFEPTPKGFMGDYNHIDAHDGRIACIWTRMNRRAQTSIRAAVFDHQDLARRGSEK